MLAWFQRLLSAQALKGLPVIGSVYRSSVTTSDTVVFECDDHLSAKEVKQISDALTGAFPNSRRLILDRGRKVKVIREPAE